MVTPANEVWNNRLARAQLAPANEVWNNRLARALQLRSSHKQALKPCAAWASPYSKSERLQGFFRQEQFPEEWCESDTVGVMTLKNGSGFGQVGVSNQE